MAREQTHISASEEGHDEVTADVTEGESKLSLRKYGTSAKKTMDKNDVATKNKMLEQKAARQDHAL